MPFRAGSTIAQKTGNVKFWPTLQPWLSRSNLWTMKPNYGKMPAMLLSSEQAFFFTSSLY